MMRGGLLFTPFAKLPLGKESNIAECDPVPTFLKEYNNEVGRRRTKPAQAPSPRWIVRGGKFLLNKRYLSHGARSRSGPTT